MDQETINKSAHSFFIPFLSSQRTLRAHLVMSSLSQIGLKIKVEESELWSVLWKHPIYEKGITLYSTIMNPSQGRVQNGADVGFLR